MSMKKISLQNMKGVLSRNEMKKISGGSGGDCKRGGACLSSHECCPGYSCRLPRYNSVNTKTAYCLA